VVGILAVSLGTFFLIPFYMFFIKYFGVKKRLLRRSTLLSLIHIVLQLVVGYIVYSFVGATAGIMDSMVIIAISTTIMAYILVGFVKLPFQASFIGVCIVNLLGGVMVTVLSNVLF
jgi:hypothetical protein